MCASVPILFNINKSIPKHKVISSNVGQKINFDDLYDGNSWSYADTRSNLVIMKINPF